MWTLKERLVGKSRPLYRRREGKKDICDIVMRELSCKTQGRWQCRIAALCGEQNKSIDDKGVCPWVETFDGRQRPLSIDETFED